MRWSKLEEVCFEITDLCPMECIHCSNYNSSCSLAGSMDLSKVKEIIDEIVALGGSILDISGGEPLLHSRLLEIITYANTRGLRTRIYTSGVISHSESSSISRQAFRRLAEGGLDGAVFNLEGAAPKTHEYITNTAGSFKKTIQSMRNAKSEGLWVGVHFVPMRPNFEELGELMGLCRFLRVDEVGVLRFVPQGRGRENREELELSDQQFFKLIQELTQLKHMFQWKPEIRVGRPIDFCPLIDPRMSFRRCNAGISKCLIKPNGEVIPCPAFKQDSRYVAGNINEQTLREIWLESRTLLPFRTFDYHRLKGCSDCPHLSKCQGRCVAQRINATDSMFQGPDPCCPMLQTIISPCMQHACI